MLAAMLALFSTLDVFFVSVCSWQLSHSALPQGFTKELLAFEGVVVSIIDNVCYLTTILRWGNWRENRIGNELKKGLDELA